jgi:hypothetical protein
MFTFVAKSDNGESITFESDSRDVANWEKTTKGATMGSLAIEGGLSFTALYRIAWFAARRLMLIPKDMTLPDFERAYAIDIEADKPAENDEDGSQDDGEDIGTLVAGDDLPLE